MVSRISAGTAGGSDETEAQDENGRPSVLIKENESFSEALHMLMHAEKVSRNEADLAANSKALCDILELCIACNQWQKFEDSIQIVTRKAGAMKQALQKFMDCGIENVSRIPLVTGIRCRIIAALRSACHGKLYLEFQHANFSKMLADLKEADGLLSDAANILGELKIETYGSMEMRDKAIFILHQMRLYIANGQLDDAQILSKKIQLKFFDSSENMDLKQQFYRMKVHLEKERSYLETSRYYYILAKCAVAEDDVGIKASKEDMYNAALNCVLAPHDKDQAMYLQTLLKEPVIKENQIYRELLQVFSSKEIISIVDFENQFPEDLITSGAINQNRLTILITRLIEQDILTLAKYYCRLCLKRMAELIAVPEKICEDTLSELVDRGTLSAKIDRYKGIVKFSSINSIKTDDHLNNWSYSIQDLMKRTNRTAHVVQKELSTNISVDELL